ncbi:MAG: hypothetical protein WDA07_13225 [Leucobacter sp.]
MPNPAPIRIDTDTWAIMREPKDHPVALVQRFTDTTGEARFLVLKWHPEPAKRRMTGIYVTLQDADRSVLWDLAPVRAAMAKNAGPPNGLKVPRPAMPT